MAEMVKGKSARLAEAVDKSPSVLTREELRFRIARSVGLNTRYDTRFTKKDLNSIHAYLCGEFFFPKRDYNTPLSPEIHEVRDAVAIEAGIDEYVPSPEELDKGEDVGDRPFRQSELEALCRKVEGQSDQRPRPSRRR